MSARLHHWPNFSAQTGTEEEEEFYRLATRTAMWQSFISSYRCRSVDEHECTKNNLIICLFECFYVSVQNIGQMVMVGPTTLKLMNECMW